MRLIHTQPPLKLQEFAENEILRYAILSHRWEKEGMNFQDMMDFNASTQCFTDIRERNFAERSNKVTGSLSMDTSRAACAAEGAHPRERLVWSGESKRPFWSISRDHGY